MAKKTDQRKKYTMQIIDDNGRIIKSETFFEFDNGKERTITLLPAEKNLIDSDPTEDKNLSIIYILESRGDELKYNEKVSFESFEEKRDVLIIKSK